jgi:hypothetical protein
MPLAAAPYRERFSPLCEKRKSDRHRLCDNEAVPLICPTCQVLAQSVLTGDRLLLCMGLFSIFLVGSQSDAAICRSNGIATLPAKKEEPPSSHPDGSEGSLAGGAKWCTAVTLFAAIPRQDESDSNERM